MNLICFILTILLIAPVLDEATCEMLYKKGRKSLSLADCEEKAQEIPVAHNFLDWVKVIER